MNDNEACRKIAALTAIVQTMMHEVYCAHGTVDGRESFDLQLVEDELLAMAIANELGEEELAQAFGWVEAAFGSNNDELSASPVARHLRAGQRGRARVALLAVEEADHAHTLAVRMPDRPGARAPWRRGAGIDGRGGISRANRDRCPARARSGVGLHHDGETGSEGEARPHHPEPWRKHAAKRLAELRARIRETLEPQAARELGMKAPGSLRRCVAQPSVCCPGPLRPAAIAPMRRFTRAVVAGERSSPMKE